MREPRRLAILGVGLIGGSVGLAARRAGGWHVVGYDPVAGPDAVGHGAIHEAAADPAAAVADADLVVLAVPVGRAAGVMRSIAGRLGPAAVVTDVCSTKRSVVAAAGAAGVRFVGSHPMAGGERNGVAHARHDLLTGALCLVTPTANTDPEALGTVDAFWRSLGMQTRHLPPDEHDRRVADVSHVPHVAAAAVVRAAAPEAVPLAAGGWRDTTRVAGGDPDLWRDILTDNRDHVAARLRQLRDDLGGLIVHLESNDADAVREWLATAASARRDPPGDRGAAAEPRPTPS